MKQDEAEAVLRGKVDLILDSIASIDTKAKVEDSQLARMVESLKELGSIYYNPYEVMVMPGPDDVINPEFRKRVDLILASIASINTKVKIEDPQLAKIVESFKELGSIDYNTYEVMVMPGPDDVINPEFRKRVDLILASIASIDTKVKIEDPQLAKIVESFKELGSIDYNTYEVMVMPGPDDVINPALKKGK